MNTLKLITTDPNVPDGRKIIEVTHPLPDSVTKITAETIKTRIKNRDLQIQNLNKQQQDDNSLLDQIESDLNLDVK